MLCWGSWSRCFGPTGSGSISQRYGSAPKCHGSPTLPAWLPHLHRAVPLWQRRSGQSAGWSCVRWRPWRGRRPGSRGRGTGPPGSQPGTQRKTNVNSVPDTPDPPLCPRSNQKYLLADGCTRVGSQPWTLNQPTLVWKDSDRLTRN